MGQIAHVTEHAAILGHGLFRSIIAAVDGMRTHVGKDTGEQRARELLGGVETERVVSVDAEVLVGGHIPGAAMALGTPAKPAQ